ncbi:MAG: DNA polymerase IV [Bacteroidales bacterium]|nr:DNA polymerase IV [Bacteroidales bacterium]
MEQKFRKIIHVDMDAFYASIEQRDNPEYRNKPIAVGGSRERGVVAAASYEARKFGVYSAMPSVIARKKCPEIIFVAPRFDVYRSVSKEIMGIFKLYTDLVEPLSLDEAFLDVTVNKKNYSSATQIAKEIKVNIREKTGLTASAGVSINKFLAKIASDFKKPDGLFVIKPQEAESFVDTLPIEKFFGVGKVTAQKMHSMNIHNGNDLKQWSLNDLVLKFGKVGQYYYDIARAVDHREVNPDRIRKSVGAECTFEHDLQAIPEIIKELLSIAEILHRRINKSGFRGRTLTLKVKFSDFKQITRSRSINQNFDTLSLILETAQELVLPVSRDKKNIRLLGLSVSNSDEYSFEQQLKIDF